jgi:hypothetical protein
MTEDGAQAIPFNVRPTLYAAAFAIFTLLIFALLSFDLVIVYGIVIAPLVSLILLAGVILKKGRRLS